MKVFPRSIKDSIGCIGNCLSLYYTIIKIEYCSFKLNSYLTYCLHQLESTNCIYKSQLFIRKQLEVLRISTTTYLQYEKRAYTNRINSQERSQENHDHFTNVFSMISYRIRERFSSQSTLDQ